MFTGIQKFVREYTRKRTTVRELSRLSDRELRDLGISRCDIDSVASGKF